MDAETVIAHDHAAQREHHDHVTRRLTRRIRGLLSLVMLGLLVSGLTAIPLRWEITLLHTAIGPGTEMAQWWPAMAQWIATLYQGIRATDQVAPFMRYGTDWLAFAHIVIAIAFLGPYRDPVRNRWVVEFGLIACGLVIPTAFLFGPLRGIPFFWQLIDGAFGVAGSIPLWLARRAIIQLETLSVVERQLAAPGAH